MIVGTAGHIDHGKTALVKALTGTDADRLKEEKERGITIDLGFAYWPRPDGNTIGFVDVPGHERFVHTMMAGAQALDLVMVVIAADDGIMPQTREHLEIIDLLGIANAIVVLTKADAVPPTRLAEVKRLVSEALAGSRIAGAPIVEVSSLTGKGIPQLGALLDQEAVRLVPRSTDRVFRLTIDRCFSLRGAGVVVTGMVLDGEVRLGDEVVISPNGVSARVRGIHALGHKAGLGRAGQRCALNIVGAGVEVQAITRGDVVTTKGGHSPCERIDARLSLGQGAARGLRQWMPVRVHHATAEVGARLVLIDDEHPQPGRDVLVQLVLDRPVAARALDRFILREPSIARTLGGGQFIDLRAPDRKRRSLSRIRVLEALSDASPGRALRTLLSVSDAPVDIEQFAVDRGWDAGSAAAWVVAAGGRQIDTVQGGFAISEARLVAIALSIRDALSTFHAENPDLRGTGIERLRLAVAARFSSSVFRAILGGFVKEGWLALEGGWARLSDHRIAISGEEERAWIAIRPRLSGANRFRPPRVRDIAGQLTLAEEVVRGALRKLGRAARVDEIGHDHFFLRGSVAEAVGIAAEVEALEAGWFTAAAYRDALEERSGGTVGRKVAVEILEFLDRHGVTIRRGDIRRLNPRRRDLFTSDAPVDLPTAA